MAAASMLPQPMYMLLYILTCGRRYKTSSTPHGWQEESWQVSVEQLMT